MLSQQSTSLIPRPRQWVFLACAILAGVPALTFSWSVALTGGPHLYPWAASLLFGGGIVGAAFLLAWGAEVAQLDISQALALAIVALVAILPEFAVDIYLAWQAGVHPDSAYASYASANLTGGNRLIVGFGMPLVVLLFWIKGRKPVVLNQSASLELAFLILGSVYSILIFLKGSIALWDTVVLFPLFGLYIWFSSRAEHSEPELVGPSVAIASLGPTGRRSLVALLGLFAIAVIIFSAELFAEGLIASGREFGLDEFLLIQWLAPLASEAPEMLIAIYFALRRLPGAALLMLVSATVNQWTLLVGSLPIAYSLGFGAPAALPLTTGPALYFLDFAMHRQQIEMLLTMAQTLFAVTLLSRLYASWHGAAFLLFLFVAQLIFPSTALRLYFALGFLSLVLFILLVDRRRRLGIGYIGRHFIDALRGA